MKLFGIYFLMLIFISCASKKDKVVENDEVNIEVEDHHLQKIVVQTNSISHQKGIMYLYERKDHHSGWIEKKWFDIIIGRNGFAHDSTQIIYSNQKEKIKHEGDGCSPAGIFTLGKVFSYHPMINIKMDFEQVDENDLCVDDKNSQYYNLLIDDDTIIKRDYTSFERMQRQDNQYEYGVWVNYNTNPQIAGSGSCIFLHIWKDENTATSGCTAMSRENMLFLIEWLDKEKQPVLIQTYN